MEGLSRLRAERGHSAVLHVLSCGQPPPARGGQGRTSLAVSATDLKGAGDVHFRHPFNTVTERLGQNTERREGRLSPHAQRLQSTLT